MMKTSASATLLWLLMKISNSSRARTRWAIARICNQIFASTTNTYPHLMDASGCHWSILLSHTSQATQFILITMGAIMADASVIRAADRIGDMVDVVSCFGGRKPTLVYILSFWNICNQHLQMCYWKSKIACMLWVLKVLLSSADL